MALLFVATAKLAAKTVMVIGGYALVMVVVALVVLVAYGVG